DKDLEYAKYALSIQKELGTDKKLVEQRTLEVSLADRRTEVEAARGALSGATKRLSAREPAPAEFEEAQNALAALDKALEASKPLMEKEAAFAKYIEGARKSAESARIAIDRRKLEIDVNHQRTHLTEALAKVNKAAGALSAGSVKEDRVQAASDAVGEAKK